MSRGEIANRSPPLSRQQAGFRMLRGNHMRLGDLRQLLRLNVAALRCHRWHPLQAVGGMAATFSDTVPYDYPAWLVVLVIVIALSFGPRLVRGRRSLYDDEIEGKADPAGRATGATRRYRLLARQPHLANVEAFCTYAGAGMLANPVLRDPARRPLRPWGLFFLGDTCESPCTLKH